MEQYKAKNETKLPEYTYDILHEECHEIMKQDVAIVKVRMESGKYIRTIMDKRMTFADKLAAFGIKYIIISEKNIIIFSNIFLSPAPKDLQRNGEKTRPL